MNLPQLPQPPTDNLYKFKAISGLILAILCQITPFYMNYVETMTLEDTKAKLRLVEAESDNSEMDLFHLVITTPKGKEIPEEKIVELRKNNREIYRKKIEILNETEKAMRRTNINFFFFPILAVLSLFGIFLAASGFEDWKNKLQKYQDEIIENEAKKNAEDNSNKSLIIKP
jgi:hypothetical protein